MGVRKTIKAVLKEAAGEPMKLKKLVRLVKEQYEGDSAAITKEAMIEACGEIQKVHVLKGLAWYGAEDGRDVWLAAQKKAKKTATASSAAASAKKATDTSKDRQGHKVFVSGLDKSAKWQDLKDQFKENVGPVVIVRAIPGGMAVVEFENLADAETLVDMDGDEFCGNIIRTKFDGVAYTESQKSKGKHFDSWERTKKTHSEKQWDAEENEEEATPIEKKPKHNAKITFE